MSPEEGGFLFDLLLLDFSCGLLFLLTLPHPFKPLLLLVQHLAYPTLEAFKCASHDEPAAAQCAQLLLMIVVEIQGEGTTVVQFTGADDTI